MKTLERFRVWLYRRSLRAVAPVDYLLKRGDFVEALGYQAEVVDVNWAMLSVAVALRPGDIRSVVVLPAWSVKKAGGD